MGIELTAMVEGLVGVVLVLLAVLAVILFIALCKLRTVKRVLVASQSCFLGANSLV